MLTKSNYHILVVDDVVSIHNDFRKILTPEQEENYNRIHEMKTLLTSGVEKTADKNRIPPFELEFATQSAEGVALVQQALLNKHPFAVAFVDVQMPPGEDGIETISRIWEIDHEIQTVICTAFAKYTWEDLHKKFGDSDRLFILKKPFDNLEIIQLACSLCKKWNLNRLQTIHEQPTTSSTMKRLDDAMNILSELNTKLKKPTDTA